MKLRKMESVGVAMGLDKPWVKIPMSFLRFAVQFCLGLVRKGKGDKFIVLAIPKSGSTFIENCLGNFSGRVSLMHPKINMIEFKNGSSIANLSKLPGWKLYKFGAFYSKYHLIPSKALVNHLVSMGFKVVVFNRDIDEIRLSHLNYVDKVRHHPMHKTYAGKPLAERKEIFDKEEKVNFVAFQNAFDEITENENVLKMDFVSLKEDELGAINKITDFIGLHQKLERNDIDKIKNTKVNLILEHKLK